MLSLALVGVSGYGRTHLEMVRRCAAQGLARLVAAVVVNPAAEADTCAELRSSGCRVYANFNDMLTFESGRVDLVLLPVPIHLHVDMTCAALAAGAHVLVEKPLTACDAEIDRIEEVATRHGRRVFVGFQDIYASDIQSLKAAILEGRLGRLRTIRGQGVWPRPASYYARNNWAGRRFIAGEPALDSPLNNAFAHFIMLTLFLAGRTMAEAGEWHDGEAELYRAQPIETFDTAALRLRFQSGVESLWLCTHSAHETREPSLRLEGDAGHASWEFGKAAVLQPSHGPAQSWPGLPLLEHRAHMLGCVIRSLTGQRNIFTCGTDLARAHTRLILALDAQAEIHPVAESHITTDGVGPEAQIRILGIEATLDESLAAGRLPSELGVPWSRPPAPLHGRTPVSLVS